ncbi:glycogen debranching protein GlgX [Mannheimia sp. AT1]|uniref:Glycogen debranching protein GlgX n=1 Tax=Mannheimia cairinae TaxID=3025936 RepID=A0ABT5MRC1_9PAST|nr:glycogen debranching protein GlgX [Mannheimia cairinae]MDD0824734.1 glycogen debranching protein GlgX [Mannheimia cairinae]MDD0826337.1 glycogen debranching protein GlgX [Mannheimia cairinae]
MQYFRGKPFPLGSHLTVQADKSGTNFAIFSENATAIVLCIFDKEQQETRIPMHCSQGSWHVFVEGIKAGTKYGYRVKGKTDEKQGLLFNEHKLLVDPYAKAIIGTPDLSTAESAKWYRWNDKRDNAHLAPKSVVVDDTFNWEHDSQLFTPWAETVIYEMHVKGFSKCNPNLPPNIAGTFAGLAHPESINYLKKLGVTAVELLPITYHIDETHLQKQGLANYWGYNVLGYFAVDPTLAADKENPLTEFKQMVKTLHQANIEVIMDVVFNHTAESDKNGPMLSFKGIDNANFYWLNEQKEYENWTGCGNTLNLSNIFMLRWAIDCLCYWVDECHIDGFRFDLATVLGRTPSFSEKAEFFTAIKSHSKLANIKLIAEPWDIGPDGYQLGAFPAQFYQWSDRYRDDIRCFWLQNKGDLSLFARRFAGSDDLFSQYDSSKSINFITAHDGFNLQDLVSYNHKHNLANGEHNRDGHNENHSYNHGIEGQTTDKSVKNERETTACALLATLLLSAGVPMLFSGDEMGHSQQGNNNCYCQDNERTWLDWENANLARIEYVSNLIALRKKIPILSQANQWWTESSAKWLNTLAKPIKIEDWHNNELKELAILLQGEWLILVNAKRQKQQFFLPQGNWKVILEQINGTLMTDTQAVTLNNMGVCVLQKSDVIHTKTLETQHA